MLTKKEKDEFTEDLIARAVSKCFKEIERVHSTASLVLPTDATAFMALTIDVMATTVLSAMAKHPEMDRGGKTKAAMVQGLKEIIAKFE